jgi:hypothetical protein
MKGCRGSRLSLFFLVVVFAFVFDHSAGLDPPARLDSPRQVVNTT